MLDYSDMSACKITPDPISQKQSSVCKLRIVEIMPCETLGGSTTLSLDDLQPTLDSHKGNKIFAETLKKINDIDSLFRVLCQFVQFNAVFGAGVATLASELAHGTEIFRDPDDPMHLAADRSCEVA